MYLIATSPRHSAEALTLMTAVATDVTANQTQINNEQEGHRERCEDEDAQTSERRDDLEDCSFVNEDGDWLRAETAYAQ